MLEESERERERKDQSIKRSIERDRERNRKGETDNRSFERRKKTLLDTTNLRLLISYPTPLTLIRRSFHNKDSSRDLKKRNVRDATESISEGWVLRCYEVMMRIVRCDES
jgi:hypothetical protein